jgi:hypothetical protein
MGKYKDKHGTTRVGDFLRDIDLGASLKVVGNLAQGNIDGAIDIITGNETMTEEERAFALQVMELDIQEMKGVSSRWESDMKSDSWLSKNVRPLSLTFLTITTVVLIYIDAFDSSVTVPSEWIDLLKSLLLGIYIAYFGSRGMEKYRSIGK